MKTFYMEYTGKRGNLRETTCEGESEDAAIQKHFGNYFGSLEETKKHIKRIDEIPLSSEQTIDESLIHRMRTHADGASNHTVNKALHYYRVAFDKKAYGTMKVIETNMRIGIQTGNWKPLNTQLMMWF